MNKGIVLLALGSPIYGQMALNAAMSLKNEEPEIQIALFYTDGAISTLKKTSMPFFDSFYKVDEKDYMVNGKPQYQICKLRVFDYSPFEETIYLDVDMLWCPKRKPSWLFGELDKHDFTIACGQYYDIVLKDYKRKYQLWGDPLKIIEHHGLKEGKLWETWSAFIYFKKTDKIKIMFDKAIEVYLDQQAPCYSWAGGKPDEYCFNVAMNLTGLDPHQQNFVPIYCPFVGGRRKEEEIKKSFWGYGFTGNKLSKQDNDIYNRWVNQLCINNKLLERFYHVNKKDLIPEREKA